VIGVNERGVFLCIREQVRAMKAQELLPERLPGRGQRGAIVNVASVAGFKGAPNVASYITSKHGIVGLAKAATRDCIKYGIGTNNVAPGLIVTPVRRDGSGQSRRAALT
jgi:NAD(P)-dependent dehydrogenase (short-subunit alcohol dehydrogenase family)